MPTRHHSPLANRALLALGLFTFASWALIAAALLGWAPARAAALRTVARAAAAWPHGRVHAAPAPAAIAAPLALDLASIAPRVALASAGHDGFAFGDDEDGFSWCVTEGGPGADPRRARLRFVLDGEEYVVRDPALVAEAQRAAEPLRRTGREMGALGAEMGRQGAELGRVGGDLGAASARVAAAQARLAARDAARGDRDAAREQLDEMRGELARMRQQLAGRRAEHAERQRELARRMSELSARQRELAREAREQVREIARRALREGRAERPHANA